MAARTRHPEGCVRRALVLLLILAVLAVSRDMPAQSASGIELLTMKLRWSIAWAGLHARSPLRPLAAHLALSMDPRRRTGLGRRAARVLAIEGSVAERLRWSAALTRADRRNLPLFVRALRAALATSDCASLRTAVKRAQRLSAGDRARVAAEFGRRRYAHWGPTGLRAGLRVSQRAELRRALQRTHRVTQRRPAARAGVASCAM
jgi:hypothetical protein